MSREEEQARWNKYKKLITFLYSCYGMKRMMELMANGPQFKAKKREYVYRLGVWGVAKTALDRVDQFAFSPVEELHLCLSDRATAWDEYWKMVSLLSDRELDLGLLFRCARAVDTLDQGIQLHDHIERGLQRSDRAVLDESSALLRILQGYILHQAGEDKKKVRAVVDRSVPVEARDDFPSIFWQAFHPRTIDAPASSLASYAKRVWGTEPGATGRSVQHALSTQLPRRANETASEGAVRQFLGWCLEALEVVPVPNTLLEILETPCADIKDGSAHRLRVCVFSFLVLQFLDHPSPEGNSLNRMRTAIRESRHLCISVYDILFTLTIMMLGPPSTNFEHLGASLSESISFAHYGGSRLPQGRDLFLLFLDAYSSWTHPTQNSVEDRAFKKAVFESARNVMRTTMRKALVAVRGGLLGMFTDEAGDVDMEMEVETQLSTGTDLFVDSSMFGDYQDPENIDTLSPSQETAELQSGRTHLPPNSVESFPEQIFDLPDPARTIDAMTAATSHPTTKGDTSIAKGSRAKATEADMVVAVDTKQTLAGHRLGVKETEGYESDTDTIYSLASQDSAQRNSYLQSFLAQFLVDCPDIFPARGTSSMKPKYLEQALKEFASRLHTESSNPFQWEAAVTLHKARHEVVERVLQQAVEFSGSDSLSEEVGTDDDDTERKPFVRSPNMTSEWLDGLEPPHEMELPAGYNSSETQVVTTRPTVEGEAPLPHISAYETFICKSDAYAWLLSKMERPTKLSCGTHYPVSEVGAQILGHLLKRESLRRMSRRRPTSTVTMTFELEWDPGSVLPEDEMDCHPSIDDILCLTGTLHEAQATTVAEYMRQTWPGSCHPIMALTRQLISLPQGNECHYPDPEHHPSEDLAGVSPTKQPTLHMRAQLNEKSSCIISVTGGAYAIAEIGDQIGWLSSALRRPPSAFQLGIVSCHPRLERFKFHENDQSPFTTPSTASCRMSFAFEQLEDGGAHGLQGTCWSGYFQYAVLACGYPVLSRPWPNTGLEASLGTMAFLTRSSRVVQWDKRIMMKGFSSLAIATLAVAGAIVWHLIVSEDPNERIAYTDPKLDDLVLNMPEGSSLRSVESSRHFIGWCVDAVDLCGRSSAKLHVKPSGLGGLPAYTAIDRLYIEAGTTVVAGLNMCLNKKQQPVRLTRERDYPSLLNWVKNKVISLYDVSSRRAWLVDGASALLHMLRIWLELNQRDPESAYVWVFDPSMLKDSWEGCTTARQAALKTLKSPENLDLGLYVIEGDKKAKLRTRVKDILLDLELMVDWQEKGSSPDGINIPQNLNLRKRVTGFDIFDVVVPERVVQPRVQTLGQTMGPWREGWSDLVSELGILTIFGSGFGGIIRPSEDCVVCPHWQSLPRDQEYMAASVATLQILHQQRSVRPAGQSDVDGLTTKMAWYSEQALLSTTVCSSVGPGACGCNPVQVLSSRTPWLMSPSLKLVNVKGLDGRGAVIFGHRTVLGGLGQAKRDTACSGELSTEGSASTSNAGAGSSLSGSGGHSTEESPPTSNASSQWNPLSPRGWGLWDNRRKKRKSSTTR